MNPLITEQLIFNPTSKINGNLFFSTLSKIDFQSPFKVIKNQNVDGIQPATIYFTTPVVRIEKPVRTSKKTGLIKPKANYYYVFDENPLGSGNFGSVHRVIGAWTCNGETWEFKEKKDPTKKRLIKTNAVIRIANLDEDIFSTYTEEYEIGHFASHMGYKYKPCTYNGASFLLLRELPGQTLHSLLQELEANPNLITVTQRLQITVNLLKALDTQISGVKIHNSTEEAYLVHRDIKPENVMVDEQGNINYIDYGLAQNSAINTGILAGTIPYIDPLIEIDPYSNYSKTSDLFSLAWTIAEIWGYKPGPIRTMQAMIKRKINGLFDNIEGLTDGERFKIEDTLKAMTNLADIYRLTREVALKDFELLLDKRLATENKIILELANLTPLDQLKDHDIICVLNSNKAYLLIERFLKEPHCFQMILSVLKDRLIEVNPDTLLSLKAAGLDFSTNLLTIQRIQEYKYSSEQVKLLIKLGSTLDTNALNEWLTTVEEPLEIERWASIADVLYASTEERDSLLLDSTNKKEFKSIYYHEFLKRNKETRPYSGTIKLIHMHIGANLQHSYYITKIREILERPSIKGSALAHAIESSSYLDPLTDVFYLWEDDCHQQLFTLLETLAIKAEKIQSLTDINGMPLRNKAVAKNKLQLNRTLQLQQSDWQCAIKDAGLIGSALHTISIIDTSLSHLEFKLPPELCSSLKKELDELVTGTTSRANICATQTDILLHAYDLVNEITLLKSKTSVQGKAIYAASGLDEVYALVLGGATIKNANQFNESVLKCHHLYAIAQPLFGHSAGLDLQRIELFKTVFKAFASELLFMNSYHTKIVSAHLTNFLEVEAIFFSRCKEHPEAYKLIYDVLTKQIMKKGSMGIYDWSNTLASANLHRLLDPKLLKKIEKYLELNQTICTEYEYRNKRHHLKNRVVTYLQSDFENKADHRRQFLKKMDNSMTELQTRDANNIAKVHGFNFFPRLPANCTEHDSQLSNRVQPSNSKPISRA